VEFTVSRSRETVDWLVELGVDFDLRQDIDASQSPEYHLAQEGGHSHRRIVHAADRTGGAIGDVLQARARAGGNIDLLPGRIAVDLVRRDGRCRGVYVLDDGARYGGPVRSARRGAGQRRRQQGLPLYQQPGRRQRRRHCHGLARRLPGREHGVQPVPPDLPLPSAGQVLPDHRGPARRGRALLLPDGERFMPRFDERAELAPRDIVARPSTTR
jgi:L-aspartate oxidase